MLQCLHLHPVRGRPAPVHRHRLQAYLVLRPPLQVRQGVRPVVAVRGDGAATVRPTLLAPYLVASDDAIAGLGGGRLPLDHHSLWVEKYRLYLTI